VLSSPDEYPTHWLFISSEIFINFVLFTEIGMKLFVQTPKHFIKSKSNIFDLVVLFLCIISLCFYLYGPTVLEQLEGVLSLGLLAFRYVLQFLRLFVLLKNQHQKFRANSSSNQIQFDNLLVSGDEDDSSEGWETDRREAGGMISGKGRPSIDLTTSDEEDNDI